MYRLYDKALAATDICLTKRDSCSVFARLAAYGQVTHSQT